jgi:hypothetical protein
MIKIGLKFLLKKKNMIKGKKMKTRNHHDRRKNRFERRIGSLWKTTICILAGNYKGRATIPRRKKGERREDWIRYCPHASIYSPK